MSEETTRQVSPNDRGCDHAEAIIPVSICLLGLTFDSPNLGVGALLDGSMRGILASCPDAKISILDYGYEAFTRSVECDGRSVPIDFVNLRFSKKIYLANNIAYLMSMCLLLRYLAPTSVEKYFVRRNRILRHISTVDTVA